MVNQEKIYGFVLAGGKSRRMGEDKGLMKLGEKPLVVCAAEMLIPFVQEVRLLAPPERFQSFGFTLIPDLWPEAGPLAAVSTGLISSDAAWNIFLACDLPLVSPKLLELLVGRVHTTPLDAVVPRTEDGWQPLAAAYHGRCRPVFEGALQKGQRSLVGLLEEIRVETITPEEMRRAGLSETEFTNINTPEEWARLTQLLEGVP